MTDRELLELIATQVGGLTTKVDGLTTRVEGLTTRVEGLTTRVEGLTATVEVLQQDVSSVKKNMVVLENKMDLNHKALFDGYKLTYEKVSRMETIVEDAVEDIQKQDVKMKFILGNK